MHELKQIFQPPRAGSTSCIGIIIGFGGWVVNCAKIFLQMKFDICVGFNTFASGLGNCGCSDSLATLTFFLNYWRSNPLGKGVIEILSSISKLGGLNSIGDIMTIAPASVDIYLCSLGEGLSRICFIGVGLSSYSLIWVRQDLDIG